MTVSITIFRIKCYYAECHYGESHYAECSDLFIAMLSVIALEHVSLFYNYPNLSKCQAILSNYMGFIFCTTQGKRDVYFIP